MIPEELQTFITTFENVKNSMEGELPEHKEFGDLGEFERGKLVAVKDLIRYTKARKSLYEKRRDTIDSRKDQLIAELKHLEERFDNTKVRRRNNPFAQGFNETTERARWLIDNRLNYIQTFYEKPLDKE